MFNSTPTPQDSAALAADPSVARAERRLALLEELAEIGMELARALKPGAPGEAPANDKAPGKVRDPAEAFAPLSRAIRLTLALEARTDEELRDLKAGIVRTREADEAKAVDQAGKARDACRDRVEDLVMSAADAKYESDRELSDFWEALDERLDQDEAYMDIHKRPLRETVERLCKDLDFTPDWSRWDGEGWIDDGPTRPRSSPFNTPSAKPLLNDDSAPLEQAAPAPRPAGDHALE